MNHFSRVLAATVLVTAASIAAAACSSSSSTGNGNGDGGSASGTCDQDPFACPTGQTCWVVDTAPTFKCLNSGAGKNGDTCRNLVGSPTCGDGLFCFQQVSSGSGVCTPYCDNAQPSRGCPNGEACARVQLQSGGAGAGPILNICSPPTPDAGAEGGTDAAPDSSADSAADTAPPDGSSDATGQ